MLTAETLRKTFQRVLRNSTLVLTSAQVVETSVNVITNSSSQDYTHPVDHTVPTCFISFVANCCLLQLNYVKICRSSFCMWGNGPRTILKRFCLLRSRNVTFPDLPLVASSTSSHRLSVSS